MRATNENSNFDPEMNQEIILIYHRSADSIVDHSRGGCARISSKLQGTKRFLG